MSISIRALRALTLAACVNLASACVPGSGEIAAPTQQDREDTPGDPDAMDDGAADAATGTTGDASQPDDTTAGMTGATDDTTGDTTDPATGSTGTTGSTAATGSSGATGTTGSSGATGCVDSYADNDGDGFGAGSAIPLCDGAALPSGSSLTADDCDDTRSYIHPGAAESCDGYDNDCSGAAEADEADADGDLYMPCSGFINRSNGDAFAGGGDCDDSLAYRRPGLAEACDGIDNNCDSALPANEQDPDGDQYLACNGYIARGAANVLGGGDCDGTRAYVFPGNPEVCDGFDNDCSDAGTAPANERDTDRDGYLACAAFVDRSPSDVFLGGDDCDPNEPGAYRTVDVYMDRDMDGAGVPPLVSVCEGGTFAPGHSATADDCNDADAFALPGAPELPDDGVDQDCAGGDLVTDRVSQPYNAVYVAKTCMSGCDGSPGAPYTSIASALAVAAGRPVLVAAGVYEGTVLLSGTIVGGYDPSDWSVRDPALFVTEITESSTPVLVNSVVSAALSGLRITAESSTSSAAIFINADARIHLVDSTVTDPTIAVYMFNGRFAARDSTITVTGSSMSTLSGIRMLGGRRLYLERNTIAANVSALGPSIVHGVLLSTGNATGVLIDNQVTSDGYSTFFSNEGSAVAWESINATPKDTALYLRGNTLTGGNKTKSSAGLLLGRSRAVAVANTFVGGSNVERSRGIHCSDLSSLVAVNNDISAGSGSVLAHGLTHALYGVYVHNTVRGGSASPVSAAVGGAPTRAVWINNLLGTGSGTARFGFDLPTAGAATGAITFFHNAIYGENMTALLRYSSTTLSCAPGSPSECAATLNACGFAGCTSAEGNEGHNAALADPTGLATVAPGALFISDLDDTDFNGAPRPGSDMVTEIGARESL